MKMCSMPVLLLSLGAAGTAAAGLAPLPSRALALAPPTSAWITLRGGAAADTKDDDDDKWDFQRVTPVVAALPAVVVGLDMLLNSEDAAKYWEGDDAAATADQKTFSVFTGIHAIFSAACLAALSLEGSDKSIKAANILVLSSCVAKEAAVQTVNRNDKFRGLDTAISNILSGVRVVLGVAAAFNIAKLYKDEEDK